MTKSKQLAPVSAWRSDTPTRIKAAIGEILLQVLSGDKHFRTEDDYVRWGLVQKMIHERIDSIFKGDE